MSWPLAYFLTWTTYGEHLHGDDRGSVDRLHNQRGTPLLPPDSRRENSALSIMQAGPVQLSLPRRQIVQQAIHDHAGIRNWLIHALNVRSNHVHVVVDCRPGAKTQLVAPEQVMGQFKSWATRRLREHGHLTAQRIWTHHGSTRWLNHSRGFDAAVHYVLHEQDNPDRFECERRMRLLHEQLRKIDEQWRAQCAARRTVQVPMRDLHGTRGERE